MGKRRLRKSHEAGQYVYFIDFENIGGLLTPLPLLITYENGESEEMMIPAEIWRRNGEYVTKLLFRDKKIATIELDPHHQTADADFSNNSYPPSMRSSRLELYKSNYKPKNLMADMLTELKGEDKSKPGKGKEAKPVPMQPQ